MVKLAQQPTYHDTSGVEPATLRDFEATFYNLLLAVISFAGVIVFIMLIIGGLRYITSGGDPKSTESAKDTITFAIGGLLVVALAFVIVRLVGDFVGVDLTNFRVWIDTTVGP